MRQFFLFTTALAIWGTLCTNDKLFANDTTSASILSIEEAVNILYSNNNYIKISQMGIEAAKAEKRQLNSAWYPFANITGGYFYMSNEIAAQANIGDAARNLLHAIPGMEQFITQLQPQLQQIIEGLGDITLSVPLIKQNITTLDASVIWPLLTGGKRIYAGKIGKEAEKMAENFSTLTANTQMVLMLNAYYTLKLSNDILSMQQENLIFMTKLHRNALRLKEEGFINKAEFLISQVAKEEASREIETALQNKSVAKNVLGTILGIELNSVELSGDFFVLDTLPDTQYLNGQILQHNAQLKILDNQSSILYNKTKIAKSNYIPNIALFAKQTIVSHNIPKNLIPRTTLGATLQWNIFDGLSRESQIKKSRIEQQQISYTADQVQQDLYTGALALRSRMSDALYSIKALDHTIEFAKELLREREKSFTEGMCTSTDVVAAQNSLIKARTAQKVAYWQYCTSLANLLALTSDTKQFIYLHNEYRH